jgi:transposase
MKALMLDFDWHGVCELFDVTERTLLRWVQAWNSQGIDGLIERPRSGRPRCIPQERAPALVELVEHPEQAEQVHWTGRKLHGYLNKDLDLSVGYSTLMRFLHEQGFRLKVPQPWPDRQDEALRQAFCEELRTLQKDDDVELWFGDESGFEGDPRPRRRWIKVGKTGRVTKNGDHMRMNATGMVCPRTGEVFFCEFTHSDTDMFQAFLDEANRCLEPERKRQILILDNASWHKAKRLDWGRFECMFLPPYSPDLNPIERMWLLIKAHWFSDFVAKNREHLIERLTEALRWAIARQPDNSRTCTIKTEL